MSARVTSATNGSSFSNDATVGTIDWSNPSNAQTSNNSYASAGMLLSNISKYLSATGFGFSIPTGSTIRGIIVEVEKSSTVLATIQDSSVKIIKSGSIGGTEQAAAGNWSTTDGYTVYGSDTDLWGQTWTAADINAANFGVGISATATGAGTAQVDHIRITIYYSDLQLDFAMNFQAYVRNTLTVMQNGTLSFFPFNIGNSVSFNTLNFLYTHANTNSDCSLTLSVGLYSLNGTNLSLANSISRELTQTSGQNSIGYVSLTATSATQNITPGTWWFGILVSTSVNSRFSIMGGFTINPQNAFPGGFIGGNMTESTNALPVSYATSNVDSIGSDSMLVPNIVISG